MVTADIASVQGDFTACVADGLSTFLESRSNLLTSVSPDALTLLDSIRALVTGGKRMRALMCYWGYRGAGGPADARAIVTAGTALELFQGAALIHDDIIDRSDTRRGAPSVHRQFRQLHERSGWALDAERFGDAAAILAGDLCLSFSEEVFASIGVADSSGGRAREIFNTMRTEVMAGQYLDILEEVAGPSRDRATAADRARSILRYKSAKYSTEHPLVLGGSLAGGSNDLLQGYSDFALPLGEAFQLRDDVLGVFGDPATTGKPAGDDLREGKRTVMVAYALNRASTNDARFLDQALGSPELTDADIERLRLILMDSGALAATESLIEEHSAASFAALERLGLEDIVTQALRALAEAAVQRTA